MTKRDVAVWFCKVVALVGIIQAVFNFASDLIGWGIVGGNFLRHVVALGLYLFVWLFSAGIGTELAAEGEHDLPLASGAELKTLMIRCAGLWLFFAGSLWFGQSLFSIGIAYFGNNSSSFYYARTMMPNLVVSFVESILGFLVAFTPRFRRFLGK